MRANRSHCLAFPVCPLSSNYAKTLSPLFTKPGKVFCTMVEFQNMSKDFSNLLPFHDDCIFSNGSCSCSLFSIGSAVCTKRQKFQIYNIWVHWHFIAIGMIYLRSCYTWLDVGLRFTTRARSLWPSLTQTIAKIVISYKKIYDMLNLRVKIQLLYYVILFH